MQADRYSVLVVGVARLGPRGGDGIGKDEHLASWVMVAKTIQRNRDVDRLDIEYLHRRIGWTGRSRCTQVSRGGVSHVGPPLRYEAGRNRHHQRKGELD